MFSISRKWNHYKEFIYFTFEPEDLPEALQFKEFITKLLEQTVQLRQGIVISASEEIAYINGFIDKEKLAESAKAYGKSTYGEHLKAVAEGRVRY